MRGSGGEGGRAGGRVSGKAPHDLRGRFASQQLGDARTQARVARRLCLGPHRQAARRDLGADARARGGRGRVRAEEDTERRALLARLELGRKEACAQTQMLESCLLQISPSY